MTQMRRIVTEKNTSVGIRAPSAKSVVNSSFVSRLTSPVYRLPPHPKFLLCSEMNFGLRPSLRKILNHPLDCGAADGIEVDQTEREHPAIDCRSEDAFGNIPRPFKCANLAGRG